MGKMVSTFKRFLKEEDGVTAIEYGLIAGIIAVGIAVLLVALRDEGLGPVFEEIKSTLTDSLD